jgi:hypothetical protein
MVTFCIENINVKYMLAMNISSVKRKYLPSPRSICTILHCESSFVTIGCDKLRY